MITDDDVMRLFERADPARAEDTTPDVDATGYLATLRARSSNVTLIDTEPNRTGPQSGHRRLLITVAAAAAVVAIIVGAVVLAGRDGSNDPQIPAGTTAAPASREAAAAEQIARQFVTARDSWDSDSLLALVADDAVLDDFAVETVDDYPANTDFERIMEWRFQQPQCRVAVVGPPAEVTCTYLMSNALTTALDVGPYTGSSFEFVIDNGQVQEVTHRLDISRYSREVFDPFLAWNDAAHPGDNVMFVDSPDGSAMRSTTAASLAQAEQRVPEFAAVQTALRYLEARNDWDSATAGALVADDAAIDDNRYTADGVDDVHLATAEYERITDWRHQDPQCRGTTLSRPPVEVICRYTMANAMSAALDAGPYEGSRFELLVDEGQIQQVTHVFDYTRYSSEVFEVFTGWLEETHPGELEVLFTTRNGDAVGRLTPDALAIWEQRLPEWVASLGGS